MEHLPTKRTRRLNKYLKLRETRTHQIKAAVYPTMKEDLARYAQKRNTSVSDVIFNLVADLLEED